MKRHSTPLFNLLLVVVLSVSFGVVPVLAQMRVGQPAGAPDKSAALDINGGPYTTGSQYRGLIPPKASLTKSTLANPITDPAVGLLIYNTAKTGDVTPGYYYWDGTKWLRFNTIAPNGARLGADGDYVPGYTLAGLRALTTALNNVILVEPGQEGLFRIESSSAADDGGTLLVTAGGQRYRRITLDNRITPQMFGANGTDTVDDGAAMLAWINAVAYEHYLPAGRYYSSVNLLRNDKGAFTLRGAGPGKTYIIFTNDTDGLTVTNNPVGNGGNVGLVHVEGINVVAGMAMSQGRIAMKFTTQHDQQPGLVVRNCASLALNPLDYSANGYPIGLNIDRCSSTTVDTYSYTGRSASTGFIGTGILITTPHFDPPNGGYTGAPGVNHIIRNIDIRGIDVGVRVKCEGNPGIEGVSIDNARIVSGNRGLYATSTGYLATLINLNDFHCEIYGPAIDVDGYTQVQTNNCLLYLSQPPAGINVAPYAVRYNNPINIRGNLDIVTFCPVAQAVDLTGTGNTVVLDVVMNCYYGATHAVRNGSGIANADLHVNRLWGGNFGTDTGLRVLDMSPGNARVTGRPDDLPENALVTPDNSGVLDLRNQVSNYVTIPATYAGNLTNVLAYGYRTYTIYNQGKLSVFNSSNIQLANSENLTLTPYSKLTLKYLGNHSEEISRVTKRNGTVVSGSTTADVTVTVDVSLYKQVTVFQTGSYTLTILLDKTNCNVNDDVLIKRYNGDQNGSIVIKNIDYTSGGYIQDENSNYNVSYQLPTTSGSRQRRFSLSGQGYWDFIN